MVLSKVQEACPHCLQEHWIRSPEAGVCAQAVPSCGASDFPPEISPSHGVSGFPGPSCPLAPGSGPTAPAAFYVLISPLCSVALCPARPPPPQNSSLGGGHVRGRDGPCLPGGFICNLMLAPGTGVRALPQ